MEIYLLENKESLVDLGFSILNILCHLVLSLTLLMLCIWGVLKIENLFFKKIPEIKVMNIKRKVVSIFTILLGVLIGWMWGSFCAGARIPTCMPDYDRYNIFVYFMVIINLGGILGGILGYMIRFYCFTKTSYKIKAFFLLILILFLLGILKVSGYLFSCLLQR